MHTFRGLNCLVFIIACAFLHCVVSLGAKKDCVGQDQCSCQFTDDQSVIDITSLGNSDETPKFKDVAGQDGSAYSYNPCFPFNEQKCSNAAVCLVDGTNTASIGSAESAKFAYDEGTLAVGYTAGSGILSLAQIMLKCDESACEPKFEALGSQGLGQYQFTLTTVCACPNGCDASGPISDCKGGHKGGASGASGGLSGGSIILIVFFILLMMYLVGGVLYMKLKVKANGKEVLPNVNFWSGVPSFIKDGFLFTLRPCIRRK